MRIWEFTIPIPHWILTFFHIKGGLLVRIEVSILAHNLEDVYNIFRIEVSFIWYSHISFPQHIEESRIIFRYLWLNWFYQEDTERACHMPSRVSLTTGVTAWENSTHFNTPELPSSPEPIIPPNHFTLGLQVPSTSSSQSRPPNWNRPPFTADLTVDQIFAQIRSGVDLDQLTFWEGNITFCNLHNIDCDANPRFYNELFNTVDHSFEKTSHKETENEEEEEELHPLPVPDWSLTQEWEPSSSNLQLKNMNNKLGKHLETEIEEVFWERMTMEPQ